MPKNLIQRNGTYYARVQINGKDIRKSLRTGNRREAAIRLKAMLAQLSPYHGGLGKDFDAVMAEYMLEASRILKPKTLERYTTSLLILTDHFGGMEWGAITKQAVLGFIDARKRQGVSTRTIKNDLSVLSGGMDYAVERDWAGTNAVTLIGKRALRYRPKVFVLPPPADIELVIGCAAGPLEDLFRFYRHTGLRRDEARLLRWENIDLMRRAATIPDTKNHTTRTVSLGDAALAVLAGRPRDTDWVFTRRDGQPYSGVSQGWREARLRAEKIRKFRRISLHGLRHVYAIEYLRRGGGLYALQKQLGHSSIRQTEWYLQFLTPEEHQVAQNPAQPYRFASDRALENTVKQCVK